MSSAKLRQQSFANQRQNTWGSSRQHSVETEDEPLTLCQKIKVEGKKRAIILVCIVILAGLTIHDVALLVQDYLGNPKSSEMNMMFNESMKMPNMTFCMPKTLVQGHIKYNDTLLNDVALWDAHVQGELKKRKTKAEFLAPGWSHEMYAEAYDMIATLNSLERETHPQGFARSVAGFAQSPRFEEKRKTMTFWLTETQKRGVTFQEFQNKVGIGMLAMSLMSFQRTTFNDDNENVPTGIKISWLSMMQMCFQPTFNETVPIDDQGQFFKFQLKHDNVSLFAEAHECISVDFHGRPSSMARFLEGKGRAKDGFSDSLCVSQKSDVTVELRALYNMLENDDNGTACRDGKKDSEEVEEGEFDCRSRCRMEMIQRLCNCTGITLEHLQKPEMFKKFPHCDYGKCTVDPETEDTDQECAKKCYRPCEQTRYEIDFQNEGPMVNPLTTLIVINWGSFEYLTLTQKYFWSITTFIAALGGSIGMWLGLSILTLIQGITFITSLMTKEVKHQRHEVKLRKQTSHSNSMGGVGDKSVYSMPDPSLKARNASASKLASENTNNSGKNSNTAANNQGSDNHNPNGNTNSGFQSDDTNKANNGSTNINVD